MKVISITEDNHGFIGLAINYKAAVAFLVSKNWITDNTDITIETSTGFEWKTVKEYFGKDWLDIMTDTWDINDFNFHWDCSFRLEEIEIYE